MLFHDFALKVCTRYSSITANPEIPMQEGFMKMFRIIKQCPNQLMPCRQSIFQNWFKDILIDACIESSRNEIQELQNNLDEFDIQSSPEMEAALLSPNAIINTIRMLSFYHRTVFNL